MKDQASGGRSHAIFSGAVPDEVAEAYFKLAEVGGVPEEEAAAFTGGEHVLRQLIDRGMVFTPNPAGKTVAAPERMAILGVANAEHKKLLTQERRVLGLVQAAYEHDDHHLPGTLNELFEFYTDRDEISGVSATLINNAHKEYLSLDNLHRDTRLAREHKVTGMKAIQGSITRRCIYDRAFMQDPAGRQHVQDSIAEGEQARVYPGIEMKMQISDASAVLLPCTLSGMGGAVLVRAQPIIFGFRQLFRLLWEKAVPVSGPPAKDDPLTQRQRQILDLLAQGLRSTEIAKKTGLSISMVHKHTENICRLLNATSPWQAGIEAHRRGWVA